MDLEKAKNIERNHTLQEYQTKFGNAYAYGKLNKFESTDFVSGCSFNENLVYWCIKDDNDIEEYYETNIPYTAKPLKEGVLSGSDKIFSHQELASLEKELYSKLENYSIYPEYGTFSNATNKLCDLELSLLIGGDWKHDHLATDMLVEEFCKQHNFAIAKKYEEEDGSSDSDSYDAWHYWDLVIDEDGKMDKVLDSFRTMFKNKQPTEEALTESMQSEVTKWWKEVEDKYQGHKGWHIDNGDYSDTESMHAAMFDMIRSLEGVDNELAEKGRKIYNKYEKFSKLKKLSEDNKLFSDKFPEEDWTKEDIELYKSTDWKARNYKDLDAGDEFKSSVFIYDVTGSKEIEGVVFHKFIRANSIFPPYYRPTENPVAENIVGPMFDGNKHGKYDIHDRYESTELNNILSEEKKKKKKKKKTPKDRVHYIGRFGYGPMYGSNPVPPVPPAPIPGVTNAPAINAGSSTPPTSPVGGAGAVGTSGASEALETKKKNWNQVVTDWLSLTEFELIKNENGTWSLHDLQGGNLGDIELDEFTSADEIIDRMDVYFQDYVFDTIAEDIDDEDEPDFADFKSEADIWYTWYNDAMEKKYPDLKSGIDYCEMKVDAEEGELSSLVDLDKVYELQGGQTAQEASSAMKKAYQKGDEAVGDLIDGKAIARIKNPDERAMLVAQKRLEKSGKTMSDRPTVAQTLDRKEKQAATNYEKKAAQMQKAGIKEKE